MKKIITFVGALLVVLVTLAVLGSIVYYAEITLPYVVVIACLHYLIRTIWNQ